MAARADDGWDDRDGGASASGRALAVWGDGGWGGLVRHGKQIDRRFADELVVPATPALLIDDVVDSGWTITVVGALLRRAGSGAVHPLALAMAAGR